ncbi:MAG: Molybdenum cofactor biosynthesis protein MoaB [Candidatus Carbobacillus altaicus]|uniref:Molybdenum cofactor biosynthesis protein B n=1 Tax=Candidatus Carbonibacillus altaicus TaxID=2163959 RepID=A0A2R6Y3P0_9BACL|nr:MAG: Molybdenum cofactor biosynthesis protein MoaB [Candidatus Carbobacillus altaicus]
MGQSDCHRHSDLKAHVSILTISDTRTIDTDESGRLIREKLESAGHTVVDYRITTDDTEAIREVLVHFLDDASTDAIVTNGGTGISPRDQTVEVVSRLLDKTLDGFGELFRFLSYEEIGSSAMMSRAIGGIARGKPVFALPGSKAAVRLGMERLILPELPHLLYELQKHAARPHKPHG